MGEGITAEKLPVHVEDYNIFDKEENRYFYKLSRERKYIKEELTVTPKYVSPEQLEIAMGIIKEKREREAWIIDYEEQPVVEPEMEQLIEQWRI